MADPNAGWEDVTAPAKSVSSDGWEDVTTGGAAVGNPKIQAKNTRALRPGLTASETLRQIGYSTALGGAAGLVAPELLTAVGGAAGSFPVTAPLAAPLMAAGSALRGHRVASGISGVISGAASESLGQGAEHIGASPVVSEGARLAGGFVNEITPAIVYGVKKFAGIPTVAGVINAINKLPMFANKPMSGAEEKYAAELIAKIRGGEKTDAPLQSVYKGLETGADSARSIASKRAADVLTAGDSAANAEIGRITAVSTDQLNSVMDAAQKESAKILAEANSGAVAKRQNALPRIREIGDTALQTARDQRIALGAEKEFSDIGNDLRGVIVPKQQAEIEARDAAFKALKAKRDTLVAEKEASGQFVESDPGFKLLLKDLESKLLNTKEARANASGIAPVTEQGVLSNYQRIYDAVKNRRVQSGVNEEGNPTYETFKTSFDALDEVRRKLGQVFNSKTPPEGYEAINANTARNYYDKIKNIQNRFGGEYQVEMQRGYHDATEGLANYNTASGKKFTAVDRYNDSEFVTDAKALPKKFFGSKQGISDLIELTGDKTFVEKAAGEFASKSIKDMTEKQVRTWMRSNSELMASFPSLHLKIETFADGLARGERISNNAILAEKVVQSGIERARKTAESNAAKIISKAETEAGRIERSGIAGADREAARIRTKAQQEASAITGEGEKEAATLLGNKFPVARVKQLIESGDANQWKVAGPAIASNPESKKAAFDAVRQVMADKAKSPAGIVDFWERNVRPGLEVSGLITKAQGDDLAQKLLNVEKMKMPKEKELGWKTRLLLNTINGYASTLGARSLVEQIPK